MKIIIKEKFKEDYITRDAGEKLRRLLANSIRNKEKTILDFKGATIASTSFFDEGFAKLALEGITSDQAEQYLTLLNLHPKDKDILFTLCKKRKIEIKRSIR